MNVNDENQHKGSSDGSKDNESDFQFYGGMVWKQGEYTSEYHYCYTPEERAFNGGRREDQLRTIRDKCITLYKKYTSKDQ